MKKSPVRFAGCLAGPRLGQEGNARVILLTAICLAAGFAGGALWYYRMSAPRPAEVDAQAAVKLSDGTKAVLRGLDAPVEIRFYALLGQEGGDDALRAFAGRADQLLAAFEQAAGGKLEVKRHTTSSDDEMTAAAADGLRPFNLEKGDTHYLGATITRSEQKETLAQLSPEWEPALESDLSRAVERVARTRAAAVEILAPSTNELAATEAVQRTLPNLASMTVEEGTRILREAALKEFEAAAAEGEARLQAAQERFAQAPNTQSEAERQAAREEYLQLQAAHTAKLKSIASRLEAQTRALERLKGVPPSTPKARTSGTKTMMQ